MSKKLFPEDAFFENLLLGLNNTLAEVPRICNVTIDKRQPCEKSQLVTWEQRHGVYLPEDMKKFYLSTDGFMLQWSYQYAPNDIRKVGYIHFRHLLEISLLRENVEMTTAAGPTNDQWGNPLPVLGAKTKIFEINTINEVAKVCLLYDSSGCNISPKIYLLELSNLKWVFLADSFSEYLRMAIAHLGLPYWELCFASCGLPSWTEQLFLLLAPHLLEENETRRSRLINPGPEHPYNVIDPNIFRVKFKTTSIKAGTTGKHK
ncbi:tubulin polyglutamylase complex subunit 2 isoform X1 [Stomoxys calcitrans]|uniref:tubulin polyglutamylase complex subunit 2 isoform X1 n=1 Tax=Stomoxys calcitrans TaxID=35570 RepID=UPI0027E2770F|nr:tubulin polyglutamylase complex subunit 2 isoform X1 [Stomoxys calcitrans]